MDLGLAGKVAVVTGASKGIGLAVVRTLADEGALVVAGARTTDTLAGLDGVTAVAVDLASPAGPAALVERAVGRTGASTCWSTTSAPCGCGSTVSSGPATTSSPGPWR